MRRNSALAALADIVGVLVFCAVGRRSHAEGLTLTGVAETAWPFLAGTAVGWLLSRGWRRPTAIVPTGAVVWVCTVAVGMLLRRTTSAGVAFSFLVVASAATAVLLLGWRLLAAGIRRRGLGIADGFRLVDLVESCVRVDVRLGAEHKEEHHPADRRDENPAHHR
jgi:peptidoglycan/LPS O-acetylase OafA/YrhL